MRKPTAPKAKANVDRNGKRKVKESSTAKNKTGQSSFRSVSPIIKQAKQAGKDQATLTKVAGRKVNFGNRFSLTLGVIVVALAIFVLVVAPPTFDLISKMEDRNKSHARLAQAKQENNELREQIDLWNQEDYVKQEARERLGYLQSGETRFKVVDPGPEYKSKSQTLLEKIPPRPWFLEIIHSSQVAGEKKRLDSGKMVSSGENVQIAPGANQDPPKNNTQGSRKKTHE